MTAGDVPVERQRGSSPTRDDVWRGRFRPYPGRKWGRRMARYPVNLAPALVEFSATPLGPVLDTLTRRWTVLALQALGDGHGRFNALQRHLDGITHKVLIDTLRSLQRDGFVRGPLTGDGTEYRLTALGVGLVEFVGELQTWCDAQRTDFERARLVFEVRNAA